MSGTSCYNCWISCNLLAALLIPPEVEVTGDMALKTSSKLLRKYPQSTEKEERILTVSIYFSESDIWCLIYFGCFGSEITIFLQLFQNIFSNLLLFSLNCFLMLVSLKNDPSREKGDSFPGAISNLNIFRNILLTLDSDIFPNLLGDRQSQKWQTKRQQTLPQKTSYFSFGCLHSYHSVILFPNFEDLSSPRYTNRYWWQASRSNPTMALHPIQGREAILQHVGASCYREWDKLRPYI